MYKLTNEDSSIVITIASLKEAVEFIIENGRTQDIEYLTMPDGTELRIKVAGVKSRVALYQIPGGKL